MFSVALRCITLGYVISDEGILPNLDKILTVKESLPLLMSELRERVSWFGKFVPDFAKESGPLHMLTRVSVPFVWSKSCQEAFN